MTLAALTGGAGLSTGVIYYVRYVSSSTFALALARGGAYVDVTTNYSSLTVTPQQHLSHLGTYRIYARVQQKSTNTGVVSVALEWATGDFRSPTRNATQVLQIGNRGQWEIVDLGLVDVPAGTTQWEGRVLASCTVASEGAYVDCLVLMPTEASGEASANYMAIAAPTAYVGREEFPYTTGVLGGKVAVVGGTWATSVSATDFATTTSGIATRSAITGERIAILGATTHTNVAVQIDMKTSDPAYATAGTQIVALYPRDGGNSIQWTIHEGSLRIAGGDFIYGLDIPPADTWYTLRAYVDDKGVVTVWHGAAGTTLRFVGRAYVASAATGGAGASGKPGFSDSATSGASTRTYRNFYAWVPPSDAALFASRSTTWAWDGVTRKDSTGAFPGPMSRYEGDLLYIPASGAEGRATQIVVKASRGIPGVSPDTAIDDVSAWPTITPRYLEVPA